MTTQEGELLPEAPGAAPQRTSRGRIVAAVVLLSVAALAMAGDFIASLRMNGGADYRNAQARMDLFQGKAVLHLAYYLEAMERPSSPAPQFAREYARLGALSAAAYFEKAMRRSLDWEQRTVACASAAAVHAHLGDNWRALRLLQETLDTGRRDVLSLLARVYANSRPDPQWLRGEQLEWLRRRAPANLLIEAQVNRWLNRPDEVARAQAAMRAAGLRAASRTMMLALALAGLLLLGVGIIGWGVLRRDGFGPYRGLPQRDWGPWEGLELVGVWLVLSIALSLVTGMAAALVAGIAGLPLGPGLLVPTMALGYALASLFALLWFAVAVAPRGTGLRSAGWLPATLRQTLLGGIATYAAALPVVMAASILAVRFLPDPPVHPLIAAILEAPGWGARAAFLVLLCVIAPVAEETVFRGGLYGGLRRRWSRPAAALVSSAVFAAVHLSWASFLPVLALGVAFCVIYERAGSLLPAIIAHGLFNLGSATVILMFV